jgi:hypothetical protein
MEPDLIAFKRITMSEAVVLAKAGESRQSPIRLSGDDEGEEFASSTAVSEYFDKTWTWLLSGVAIADQREIHRSDHACRAQSR